MRARWLLSLTSKNKENIDRSPSTPWSRKQNSSFSSRCPRIDDSVLDQCIERCLWSSVNWISLRNDWSSGIKCICNAWFHFIFLDHRSAILNICLSHPTRLEGYNIILFLITLKIENRRGLKASSSEIWNVCHWQRLAERKVIAVWSRKTRPSVGWRALSDIDQRHHVDGQIFCRHERSH